MLFWKFAPPSGTRIQLDWPASRPLRVAAAAGDRRARVRLSLLGKTPVSLRARLGNPAVATVKFPVPRELGERTYVVTLVARLAGRKAPAITRTLIVSVRALRVPLVGPGPVSRWAYVLHRTNARERPSAGSPAVGIVDTTTSDAMPNLVRVVEQRSAAAGIWVKVVLTSVPNSRTGWVPRNTVSVFHTVTTRAFIDTRRLRLTLLRSGRVVFRAPIAVGAARWPTPRGRFYIRERLSSFRDPFYGPIAFGTSARSTTLTDWPGGGVVGIHGTNRPDLIPGRVSHGCIRLRNDDILRLARLMPLGTPVEIR